MSTRIATLELVARLRQNALEAQAAELRKIWARIAEIDAAREALLAALRGGPTATSLESARYLPGYLRAMRAEEAKLMAERAALERRQREAEALLLARFRETKATGRLLDSAHAGVRARADRKEAAEMDEAALRAYLGASRGPA